MFRMRIRERLDNGSLEPIIRGPSSRKIQTTCVCVCLLLFGDDEEWKWGSKKKKKKEEKEEVSTSFFVFFFAHIYTLRDLGCHVY